MLIYIGQGCGPGETLVILGKFLASSETFVHGNVALDFCIQSMSKDCPSQRVVNLNLDVMILPEKMKIKMKIEQVTVDSVSSICRRLMKL